MRVDHPGRFALLRGKLLEVPQEEAMRLACAAGELWITQDGDLRDIVLRAGEDFTTLPGRRVLVSALEDSVLEVRTASQQLAPAPRSWRPSALAA
jgi:hypothetical protein